MKKIMSSNIFWPTVVMFIIALALFIIATLQGEGKNVVGLKSAWNMTLQIIPLLIFAFIIAGLVQTLLPRDLISTWVGDESGFRGILIGTVTGALTPGGPYVSLPIAAGLLRTGASIPTMVAFVTGWSLMNIARLPLEVGIMGWRFTLIHYLSVIIFAPLAGLIATLLVKLLK
jgi:uncharacterized membrane protein YraQ (UPF0718 family)